MGIGTGHLGKRKLITRVWGRASSGVQGQSDEELNGTSELFYCDFQGQVSTIYINTRKTTQHNNDNINIAQYKQEITREQ